MKSVSFHQHTQSVASATWEIDHGLYTKPIVSVKIYLGGVLTEVLPNAISFPSNTHVTISFTAAYSGEARLS